MRVAADRIGTKQLEISGERDGLAVGMHGKQNHPYYRVDTMLLV